MYKLLTLSLLTSFFGISILKAWYVDPNRAFYPDAPYDYIRIGEGGPAASYTPVVLNEGDIAWSLDDSACDVTLERRGSELETIQYDSARCIVGPCTFYPTSIQKYKIDRASKRQNKYSPGTLKPGMTLNLSDGDLMTIVGKSTGSGTDYKVKYLNEDGDTEVKEPWTDSFDEYEFGPCEIINTTNNTEIYYILRKGEDTGSQSMIWNQTNWQWEYSDGSQNANNNSSSGGIDPTSIKYDELLGWAYFTDTPWVYSYTNLSWYYMHPTTEGFYVWNANLPDNGWILLERG